MSSSPKTRWCNAGFVSWLCFTVSALSPIVSADCPTRTGYVVHGAIYPYAAISFVRDCDDVVTIRLRESIGHQPNGKPIEFSRAELKVQLQPGQYAFGCQDERGQSTATVAITHRGANWKQPHIFRAWKADLESWTFEEVFDGPTICRTPPPISCGRYN